MSKFFVFIFEVIGWLKIAASPLIIASIIAIIIYFNFPGIPGITASIVTVLLGLIIGIIWATRVWKREGTTNFLAREIATPDLDKKFEKSVPEKSDV